MVWWPLLSPCSSCNLPCRPRPDLADPNSVSELANQLGKGADELISYVISFYVIAQFWLVHHRVFRQVAGQQEGLAWWNFAFLFTITLMPFTSDLLGKFPENPLAVDIFAVNLLAASLTTQLTIVYGRRRDLLTTESSPQQAQAGGRACWPACSSSSCPSASPG